MTSSDMAGLKEAQRASLESRTETLAPNASNPDSKPSEASVADTEESKKKRPQENSKSKDPSKDGKPSGAEAKKKAKEEKAAKRAREKQSQQQPPAEVPGVSGAGTANHASKKGIAPAGAETSSAPKHQHKRSGSTAANAQKPLALRTVEAVAAPAVPEPKKESKKVALFGHLYGSPRRTTIAGAAKDVHPAVLALGLQMSNYIVCGSSARCVATLLVFKRVSTNTSGANASLKVSRSSNPT